MNNKEFNNKILMTNNDKNNIVTMPDKPNNGDCLSVLLTLNNLSNNYFEKVKQYKSSLIQILLQLLKKEKNGK